MANLMSGVAQWLGLRAGATVPADEIPLWEGVDPKRRAGANLMSLLLALAAFVGLRVEMPADDGFGGYVPLIAASMTFALSTAVAERLSLRREPR